MFQPAENVRTKDIEPAHVATVAVEADATEPTIRMIELAIEDLGHVGGGAMIFQF
jgi:hypothetical protein